MNRVMVWQKDAKVFIQINDEDLQRMITHHCKKLKIYDAEAVEEVMHFVKTEIFERKINNRFDRNYYVPTKLTTYFFRTTWYITLRWISQNKQTWINQMEEDDRPEPKQNDVVFVPLDDVPEPAYHDSQSGVETRLAMTEFKAYLKKTRLRPLALKVFDLWMSGVETGEIADAKHFTGVYISNMKRDIRCAFKAFLNGISPGLVRAA